MVSNFALTVNTPGRPGSRVDALVAYAGRITCACLRAGATIDPDLKPHVMDLVSNARDAVGEPGRVWDHLLRLRIATGLHRPTIVDVDIFIPNVLCIIYQRIDGEIVSSHHSTLP